jgi:asparagine synthase (glutamine-hydrolysing)
MCGIFGHVNASGIPLEESRRALHRLTHRGPDQWGDWSDGRTYVGHRRLSILDLSERGRQPMTTAAGDVVIAVNGEIYNHHLLRQALRRDHEFRSSSDSEVVLHGYQEWGMPGLLHRMEGMYAGCVLDLRLKRLFLFRDRIGIKPLHYGWLRGGLAWSSELCAIEELAGPQTLALDATALYDFCTYLYVPSPKTMYSAVRKVEPASCVEIDLDTNRSTAFRYWRLDPTPKRLAAADASAQLTQMIDDSVRDQLMSDVPIGCFLSGGIDSSAVVAQAVRHQRELRTFSIGFDVERHSEITFARSVAARFDTDHREEVLTLAGAALLAVRMREWFDEPFADTSALPTYLVSRLARREVAVVLTGDGGDEVFGGYRWYDSFRSVRGRMSGGEWLRSMLGRPTGPALVRRGLRKAQRMLANDDLALYTLLLGGLVRQEKQRLRRAWQIPDDYDDYWHFRRHYRDDLPQRTRLQYLDFHTYLPDDILTKVDRTSMAVSLEARVPLLATPLVEFCFALPEHVRFAGGAPKGLIRRAYRDVLSSSIVDRPKKGFSIPATDWGAVIGSGLRSVQENLLAEQFAAELAQLGQQCRAASVKEVA